MATLESAARTVFEPTPSQPLAVADAEIVWIVQSGKLDLFMQIVSMNAAIEGARHHICRIEVGEAVFGLIPAGHRDVQVTATPLLGTKLIQVTRSELQDGEGRLNDYSSKVLEQWVVRLTEAVTDAVPPRKCFPLESGREISVMDEAQVLAPLSCMVWVDHRLGSSQYMSDPSLFTGGGYLYPVAKHAWLEATPGSRLRIFAADDVNQSDSQWEGLRVFHSHICSKLIAKIRAAEEREKTRLREKAAALSSAVHNALADLAGALEGRHEAAAEVDPRSNALLLACAAAGKLLGVEFKLPKLKAGVKANDPVWRLAKASSIRVRQVILKNKWWTQDSGPMVVFRETDNHPMALLPSSPRSYELYDPTAAKRITVDARVADGLNAIAYSFYRPFPEGRLGLTDLLAFGLRSARADLFSIILMGAAGGLLNLVVPIVTGILFDSAIPGAQRNQVLVLSLFLLVGAVSSALFTLTRNFAVLRLEGKMDVTIQAAVWDRLLRLPVPFFRKYSSGDLVLRSLAIDQIRECLTGSVLSSILSGLFSVFSFGLLFYYSWRLALMATLLSLVAFVLSTGAGYLQVRYQREVSRVRGRIAGMVLEFVNGIGKFRTSGAEGRAFAVWAKAFAEQKQISLRARRVAIASTVFNSMIPILCWAAIFLAASRLFMEGSAVLSTGSFLAFFVAFNQFLAATLQLSTTTLSVLGVVPLYERAKPILESAPEVDPEKTLPGELAGGMEVSNVFFRYGPDSPLVLRGATLNARPGEFVAIVGQSGCGKSTLLRLLLGFEKPESGAIYLDGQDLAGLDLQAVRQQIGVVLQNGRLTAGTVLSNIIGSAALTAEDAWEAARMAGLDADIRAMPMGLHTVIGEGGGTLSGGQRQRLMIARAVVAKPRILLFDEATSALDNETQAIVSRSLESLRATRIVIAHRLSTVINADRIFVLEKGAVAQAGAYQQLIAQDGIFRELAKRQLA